MRTDDERLKDVYRHIIDAVGRGDVDGLDELMAPDFVDHNPMPNQVPGRDGFKQWMAMARSAFPDLRGTVEDLVAEGDRVAARMTWRGTHHGEFIGVGTDRQARLLLRLSSGAFLTARRNRVVGHRRPAWSAAATWRECLRPTG